MNAEFFDGKRVLVVAAHPDDEVLGVGGTIHRMVQRHDCSAKAVILGEGITARAESRDPKRWQEHLERHRRNISKAASHIGYGSSEVYGLPDNRFDSIDLLDVIKLVEKEIDTYQPDIIFAHHTRDLNIDHRISCEAVMTAIRPEPGKKAHIVIAFETPSSTEWQSVEPHNAFLPQLFVPLEDEDVLAKKRAIESYESECREYPHPRSSQALEVFARRWGTVIGKEYAEAFRILRWLVSD